MTKEARPPLGLSWQTAAATPELVAPTQDPESEAPPAGPLRTWPGGKTGTEGAAEHF